MSATTMINDLREQLAKEASEIEGLLYASRGIASYLGSGVGDVEAANSLQSLIAVAQDKAALVSALAEVKMTKALDVFEEASS